MKTLAKNLLRLFLIVFFRAFLKLPGHKKIMWPLAKRFIAGETVEEALTKARELAQKGFSVTLSYTGENIRNKSGVRTATEIYLMLIDEITEKGLPADIAVKISQFNCRRASGGNILYLRTVVQKAEKGNIRVWFDAERLADRQLYMEILKKFIPRFSNIGIVVQAYARHLTMFVPNQIVPLLKKSKNGAVRICKGAYNEPSQNVLRYNSHIAANFRAAVTILSGRTNSFLQIATHDAELLKGSREIITRYRGSAGNSEVAMLLGVEEDLAHRLLLAGASVRIYCPFGKDWDRYAVRRLMEKPRYLLLPFKG